MQSPISLILKMVTTLKTAEQIRGMMPQANPERWVEAILEDIERRATLGQRSHFVSQGTSKDNISDISAWSDRNHNTLAGAVAFTLRGLGFTVEFKQGYSDPREHEPAKMVISW
jgi:hypothetical protein